MSLIRAKQIGLDAQGDIIIGSASANNNGEVLSLGLDNQVLFSDGTTLGYEYVSDLYDTNGALLLNGVTTVAAVNYLELTNATTGTGVTLASAGADANVDLIITAKGLGRVEIDGNQMPNGAVAQYSILASNAGAGDLSAVTSPNGSGDQLLRFNDTTNIIEWVSAGDIIEAFDEITVVAGTGGVFTGTQPFLASVSETVNLIAVDGISMDGDNVTNTLEIGLGFDGLTLVINPADEVNTATDYLAFYDVSAGNHATLTFDQLFELFPGNDFGYDEAIATGGVNETFVAFFTNTPVNDESITVFFNGIALRATGWTRTGDDLALVDAVNGYATDAGDIISARYNY
jgi:hypothetical protein